MTPQNDDGITRSEVTVTVSGPRLKQETSKRKIAEMNVLIDLIDDDDVDTFVYAIIGAAKMRGFKVMDPLAFINTIEAQARKK
jgi:hypothetical protein